MDEDRLQYKQRHEDFVAGLSGGSISEICLVSLVAISCYFTWAAFRPMVRSSGSCTLDWVLQFVVLWLPIVFSVTVYGSKLVQLNVLLAAPSIAALFWKPKETSAETSSSATTKSSKEHPLLIKKSFLTNYRAGMMIITCIAILAVDFPIFPRRFAKVETWGTSLMDLGVGSFVFSMGLVSARTVIKTLALPETRSPRIWNVILALKQSGSVLALGLIRLAAVKYLNYQEHVTEYGVHWNFFITLGLLPPFVALLESIPRTRVPTILVALVISAIYEIVLNKTGLGAYILVAERTGIISQNREGIFSFVGYLAIFLAGQSTGYYTLPSTIEWTNFLFPQVKTVSTKSKKKHSSASVSLMLVASCMLFSLLYNVANHHLTVSRRLANLPYVLLIISFNCGFLALYALVETAIYPRRAPYMARVPSSYEAVNQNGLFFFLVANIGTGLINMNVRTLDASPAQAIVILSLYLLTLYLTSMIMLRAGITIRL